MIFTTVILHDVTNGRYKALTITMKCVFIADNPIEPVRCGGKSI